MNDLPLALRAAVRLLPASVRERKSEEWAADLRDAAECDMSRKDLLAGMAGAAMLARSRHTLTCAGNLIVDTRRSYQMKPILSLALAGVIAVGGGLVAVGAEPLVEAFSHTPIIEVVPEPATPQELADLVIIETEIPGSGEQVPCSELLPEERGNC